MPPDLIAGPYAAPTNVRRDAWIDDLRHGRVQVGGLTDAPIPWPYRKRPGKRQLIITDALERAIRAESVTAICYHWGVGATTVWAWRRLLGVDEINEGTSRIVRRGVPADAAARGRAAAAQPEARQRMADSKRGKPMHPKTKAALAVSNRQPKPDGWGKRANAWMAKGKQA